MAQVNATLNPVIEVTDRDFGQKVIEQSRTVPVVVDFWAPWCGPCRMIGPILERLANEANGAWVLAKLNVDNNQQTAARYGIQGIPAVKGFRDGKVAAEFVGAVPEPQVRRFLQQLLPGKADGAVRQGLQAEATGNLKQAEATYREALREDAAHPVALLGLGRVLFQQDSYDEALATLQRIPAGRPERSEADGWIAKISFRQQAALSGGEIEARRKLAANPNDLDARLALASALAAKGSYREALEGLLEVVRRDRGAYRDQARRSMLSIFALLGDGHELTQEYRPQLAMLLF